MFISATGSAAERVVVVVCIASDMAVAEQAASVSGQTPGAEAEHVTAGQHGETDGTDTASTHVEQLVHHEGKHLLF